MKNFIAGFMWCFNICLILTVFITFYPQEQGYSRETRARMDDLIAGLEPLSVADLGDLQ